MAGTNFVLHSAGWLEAGLAAGYGKFLLDADQIAMLQIFREGSDPFAGGNRDGGDPGDRAGRSLTRLCAHPTQFQDGLLYLHDRRQ